MGHLQAKDLDRALRFALEAQATDDLERFRGELVPGVRRLVRCDTLGYNEIDLQRGTAVAITDAPLFAGWEERFLSLADQHPLLVSQKAGDLSGALLSDFLTEPQFHRLELYQDIYRWMEIEDQLAFGLPGPMIVAVVLTRPRRTFSERDREIIELVRPHMALAYQRAREQERTRALIQALEEGLEDRHTGVIRLDSRGEIAVANESARGLLDAYFDTIARDRGKLPAYLRSWIDEFELLNGNHRQVTIDGPRGRLGIREIRCGQDGHTLILEEQRPSPPSLEALRSQGLTRRQAQVLRLLACGKPNRQVAAELGISTATVEKHLEHIYTRLGVSSRTAALARAYA